MEANFSESFLKLSSLSTYPVVKSNNKYSGKRKGKLHGGCYFQSKKKGWEKTQDL